jgi:muramoyltetrapeptide carboxypeptidase
MLAGGTPGYTIAPHIVNRVGTAPAILTGGNLTILQSLRGTPLDLIPEGRILFIDDIQKYHYHLDRMMQNLKAGGVLERISGLLVGHFTKMRDGQTPFGKNAYEVIREAVEPWDYPVVFGFPAGHELPNDPLLIGGTIPLDVSNHSVHVKIRTDSSTS